jgi:hypothetical protein
LPRSGASDLDPEAAARFVGGQLEVDGISCPNDDDYEGKAVEHIAWCSESPCPITTSPFW